MLNLFSYSVHFCRTWLKLFPYLVNCKLIPPSFAELMFLERHFTERIQNIAHSESPAIGV